MPINKKVKSSLNFVKRNVLPGLILLLVGSLLTASAALMKLPRENKDSLKQMNMRVDSLSWREATTRRDMDSILIKTRRIELKSVETNTLVKMLYDLELRK